MNSEIYILGKLVEKFCTDFLKQLTDLTNTLQKLNIKNIKYILPHPFKDNDNIEIRVYCSTDKKQLFLMFNKSKKNSFLFLPVMGGPIPYNFIQFNTKESDIGVSTFENITLKSGNGVIKIDYGIITTYAGFIHRLNNLKEFTIDFINTHKDYYDYQRSYKNSSYLDYLKNLRSQIKKLFFNETAPELTIDKFLEENPIILKRGLHLENLMH